MEKILEIKDYEGRDGYSGVYGYEVVTDKQSIKLFINNDQSCCERWGISGATTIRMISWARNCAV